MTAASWRGLERFRAAYPHMDVTGVVLHGGNQVAHLHGWLHVLPITTLWRHP